MWLFIDCFDSFSYSLVDMLMYHEPNIVVLHPDEDLLSFVKEYQPQRIILSPGPGHPNDYKRILELLNDTPDIPILGICLGHQLIATRFGMQCLPSGQPLHGKQSKLIIEDNHHPLFKNIYESSSFIMHYHSLITISKVEEESLNILARDEHGFVMVIEHQTLPYVGMQFHPESILSPCGAQLIENWVNLFN